MQGGGCCCSSSYDSGWETAYDDLKKRIMQAKTMDDIKSIRFSFVNSAMYSDAFEQYYKKMINE